MSSATRQQLENWIRTKVVHGKVLDIGGAQLPVKDRIGKTVETDFTILDLPTPHEEKQKADIVWDLNDNLKRDEKPGMDFVGMYDWAVCLEVSEYWYDPMTALLNINQMLNSNGRLLISFHFLYPVHSPAKADMLRYTRNGAIKLLEEAGFSIVEITPRKGSGDALMGLYNHEGMRPARDYKMHDEVGVLIEAVKK